MSGFRGFDRPLDASKGDECMIEGCKNVAEVILREHPDFANKCYCGSCYETYVLGDDYQVLTLAGQRDQKVIQRQKDS